MALPNQSAVIDNTQAPWIAGEISGFRFYEDYNLTATVDRSWKERWLTRPWRPWKRTKVVPSTVLWQTPDGIFGHPMVINELRKTMCVQGPVA